MGVTAPARSARRKVAAASPPRPAGSLGQRIIVGKTGSTLRSTASPVDERQARTGPAAVGDPGFMAAGGRSRRRGPVGLPPVLVATRSAGWAIGVGSDCSAGAGLWGARRAVPGHRALHRRRRTTAVPAVREQPFAARRPGVVGSHRDGLLCRTPGGGDPQRAAALAALLALVAATFLVLGGCCGSQ
jgi:hypothetical protein